MQGGIATYGLLTGLAIALVIAAYTDLKRRQIDNGLNLAIALGAPLFWWASGLGLADIVWQLGIAAISFVALAVLFTRGGMGGGDVKMLTALALWMSPLLFFQLCFLMAVVGGAMSIAAGVRNLSLAPDEHLARNLARLGAVLWLAASAYIIFVINGGAPLQLGQLTDGISPRWLGRALIWFTIGAFLLVLLAGALIISRSQRSKLPIPYGLAISAAGLWVLATHYIPENMQPHFWG